ncbi:MAG: hypothetical protein KBD66_01435 [Candidatus Doudnabacteria bacterium]|nr:hypothetical protein [Candidatus Doudnabacteria bacterium]
MRTTITLDKDTANYVKEHTQEYQVSPKVAINELIRRGRESLKKSARTPKKKIKIQSFDFGFPPELENANFNQLAYMSDDEIKKGYFTKQ